MAADESRRNEATQAFDAPLLGGEQLRSALGFRSSDAFRAAIRSGRVPVELIKIDGRKGWFAKSAAVAAWLDSLSSRSQGVSRRTSTTQAVGKESPDGLVPVPQLK
jgi:hypothetical protein